MPHYICTECGVVIEAVSGGGALYHCQGAGRMQETEIPDEVLEENPVTHLIYHALTEHEPCLGFKIQNEYELSPGQVYPALETLGELDVAHSAPAFNSHGTLWATTGTEIHPETPSSPPTATSPAVGNDPG